MCLLFLSFYERFFCVEQKHNFQYPLHHSSTRWYKSGKIVELYRKLKRRCNSYRCHEDLKCFKSYRLTIWILLTYRKCKNADKRFDIEDQTIMQIFDSGGSCPKPFFLIPKLWTQTSWALLEGVDISIPRGQVKLFGIYNQE